MTYVLRRVGQAILVLVLAYTAAYLLLAALPGDAIIARYASPELGLTPDQIQAIRESLGADQPLIVQYGRSIAGFVTGDFGSSVASGAAVSDLIATALPQTLVLAVLGLVLAIILAVTIAFTATYGATQPLRRAFRGIPPLFVSLPVFWIGIVLIQIFSFRLGWVPVIGADPAQALILPVITLAIPIAAPLAQVLMRSIDEVREQPFVTVVRARGASTSWLLWRNVARNALLPTLTMAGLLFGELVGGAVVTETVFARAGIGQLTAQAVANRDTPVLLAVVVISTVAFVLINLIVDLLYPVLDARLRGPGRATRHAPTTVASELTSASELDGDVPAAQPDLAAVVTAGISDGDRR
ncbi:ABC transporter permease [Microbacterium lacticum]|uniref:Peptide/nickel transport system permease protein n=1 Tax=Microbacterium lacticum TaxID=33885 RepID=A0A4Y3UL44_9MICO|nr:ABC transporter permease [Microbacterium lacticum]TQM90558.1 peptide/nickel transport system permease protein [Microbacterium lacticum]GEB94794.1 peptide ABC transporter permease [Microbacterium lacticum]GGN21284.1 peptide ABC transporter permease [Microbacterium lacticum]